MGIHIPRIVSPITGEEEARPSTGYAFPVNEENLRRFRGWWKVANQEQIFTFCFLGLLTLIGLSVLVASVLPQGTYGEPGDITFLQREAQALGNQIGTWFETFFYIAGFAVLFSTNIGIIDYVSRLTADTLKTGYLARSEFWTESKIYFTIAWIMCIAGSLILFAGLEQPLVLLIIASAGGGVVMFLYSGMLIVLNRRALPEPVRLKSWRLVAMWITFVFFAILSTYLLGWYIWAAATGQL
jgi:NADH:ubiquinone oxidoreductase subunit 6 (subunit J)